MADKPVLFSAPMVRALLREIAEPGEGKTQTRRALNPQPNMLNGGKPLNNGRGAYSTDAGWKRFRYAVGDRLYVREAWRADREYDGHSPAKSHNGKPVLPINCPITYDADVIPDFGKNRQGMHMPRWASRITLEVTDVKVERLQDCSREDAIAEGLIRVPAPVTAVEMGCDYGFEGDSRHGSPVSAYASLWNHINGPGAWEANPWVAAYTFRPILGNIDQLTEAA